MTMVDIRIPPDEVETTRWEYVVANEAWYASANKIDAPLLWVQRAHPDGGVYWEFGIEQINGIGLKLGIFDDAWRAFGQRPDLLAALSEMGQKATLSEVREILDALGFVDRTERETPKRHQPAEETQR